MRPLYNFAGRRWSIDQDSLESVISDDKGRTWRPTTFVERAILLLLIWFKP